MTWLRSAAFNLAFFAATAAIGVAVLPLLALPRRALVAPMRFWARTVVGLLRGLCGIRLRVTGLEHLPAAGSPALIAAKHQSAFDTIVWLALLPDGVYVLKKELLLIPVYGWLARKARMIAVDRAAGAAAMRHLIRAGREAAAEGRQVVIFPEGTRVAPGRRIAYQPGIAALAAATGLPVIPAATDSGLCWGRRAFRKRPGTITLAILPPLPAGLRREALMARLEAAIEGESDRLLAAAGNGAAPVDHLVERGEKRLRA
jgi:1-acyl-sn-glycerol-3-phosphate acyltransferase